MSKRYFMKENKFWNINTLIKDDWEEYLIILTHGEVGTIGEEDETSYDSEEECLKKTEQLINRKLRENFIETFDVDLYNLMGVYNKDEVEVKEEIFSDDNLKKIEKSLGFKIPNSYVELMKIKNGDDEYHNIGDDMLDMDGFKGIDALVEMKYLIEDWGYPNIGIYFAWTESAGHEALLINYRDCIEKGVPSIWLLDQEGEYGRFLAKDFDEFLNQIYFEKFDSRFERGILESFKEFLDDDDLTIRKEFLKDWDYQYSEDYDEEDDE